MRPAALTAVLALGCVPALPPPAHYTPDAPVAADTTAAAEAGAYLGIWPTIGGGYTYPLPKRPSFVLEGRGQVGISHAAISPGVWWRSRPEEHAGNHFGVRLGLAAGTGDALAFVPYQLPYGGASLGFQYARGMAQPQLGSFSTSLSVEGLVPVHFLLEEGILIENDEGTEDDVMAIPFPAVYGGLDVRWDIPTPTDATVWVGASMDVSPWSYVLPGASVGIRWVPEPRSAGDDDYQSPP